MAAETRRFTAALAQRAVQKSRLINGILAARARRWPSVMLSPDCGLGSFW
jgi:hypothetical protein